MHTTHSNPSPTKAARRSNPPRILQPDANATLTRKRKYAQTKCYDAHSTPPRRTRLDVYYEPADFSSDGSLDLGYSIVGRPNVYFDKENAHSKSSRTPVTTTREHAAQATSTALQPTTTLTTDAVTTSTLKGTPNRLSDEQQMVIKTVLDDRKSVFFTGSAGTGKSFLLTTLVARLKRRYAQHPEKLAITASTALAACMIGGRTLHSWAGVGLADAAVPDLCKRVKQNKATTWQRWQQTAVLIIDEISMVDGDLFEKLEAVAREVRADQRPFGGIQLLLAGDFFQLPPVRKSGHPTKFAFEATTWSKCVQRCILLTQVFRQKDPRLAGMLNEMRRGRLSADCIQSFRALSRPLDLSDGVDAIELFPTRGQVERANNLRMSQLQTPQFEYRAVDDGVAPGDVKHTLLANFMAPERLTLKRGAQVMLIKNIDTQLVNGALGTIIHFAHERGPREHDPPSASTPLTAGSDPVKNFVDRCQYWPIVRFPLPDETYRDVLCMPEDWKTEGQRGEILAKRRQVPLLLAWALSIHKAQGQTLTKVKVDLNKTFESGQAYVALSRATHHTGLQVVGFGPSKIKVDHKVVAFYDSLCQEHDNSTLTNSGPIAASDGLPSYARTPLL